MRRRRIDAHRDEAAADGGEGEHKDRRAGHQQQDPDHRRHEEKAPDKEVDHHQRRLHRRAGRDEIGEAEQYGVDADRGDQRRHMQEGDDQSGDGTDRGADRKRGQDEEEHHAEIGAAVGQLRHHHRAERHDAGGGKIEAALLDDEMLTDRGDGKDGEIRQRRENSGDADRAGCRNTADQHQQRGSDQRLRSKWELGQILAKSGQAQTDCLVVRHIRI